MGGNQGPENIKNTTPENEGKKFFAYEKNDGKGIIILERDAGFRERNGYVEIEEGEKNRLEARYKMKLDTAKKLNKLELGTLKEIFNDQKKNKHGGLIRGKDILNKNSSINQLEKGLKKEGKEAKKNAKKMEILAKLASLKKFNEASEEFQNALTKIINGENISHSLVAEVYLNPKNRKYLDGIYEDAGGDLDLKINLKAIKDAYIAVDNQGNYYYRNPAQGNGDNSGGTNFDTKTNPKYAKTGFGYANEKANERGNKMTDTLRERGAPDIVAQGVGGITKLAPLIATGVLAWKTVKSAFNLLFKTKDWSSFADNLGKFLLPAAGMSLLFTDYGKLTKKLKETTGVDLTGYMEVPGEKGEKIDITQPENLIKAAQSSKCPETTKEALVYPMMGALATTGLTYGQLANAVEYDGEKIKSVNYKTLQEQAKTTWEQNNPQMYKKISKAIQDAETLKEKKDVDVVAKAMGDITKTDLENNGDKSVAEYFAEKMTDTITKGEKGLDKMLIGNIIDSSQKGKVTELLGSDKDSFIKKITKNPKYLEKIKSGEWKLETEGDMLVLKEGNDTYWLNLQETDPFSNLKKIDEIQDLSNKVGKKIEELNDISDIEKIRLLTVTNAIYDKIDQTQKSSFDVVFNRDKIELSSYGEKIVLDKKNLKITGLASPFKNMEQLFTAGNIINKIKYLTKNETEKAEGYEDDPFSTAGDDLQFANLKSSKWTTLSRWKEVVGDDLTVLGGSGGVENFANKDGKKALASYLNARWKSKPEAEENK